jgi:transposase
MDVSYAFVVKRVSQLKKEGKLSLKQIRKSEKQKKEIKYSEVYNTILHMLKLGCTQKDIAQKLNRSIPFVTARIKELKKDGRITKEIIQRYKKARLQREKQLRNNHQIAKACLQEEREIDSSTCAEFVSSCREMYENNFLLIEDIPLLRKAIEYNPITEYTINFMLRVCVSFNQYQEAIKFLNSCIGYLIEDPKLLELARQSRKTIIHCKKQQEAVDMLNTGMPIECVFSKVGLTESEVIELKNKYTDSNGAPPIAGGYVEIEI